MANQQQLTGVRGNDGLRGVLLDGPPFTGEYARVRLEDGRELQVPVSTLVSQADGNYFLALSQAELPPVAPAASLSERHETVVPLMAEELLVEKQPVPTGGVRIHKRTEQHEELVDMPLIKEHVDVRRVIINRDVTAPMPVRYEGETTIVPLVEEVLVVEKRLRLKEELHITRHRTEERYEERVVLNREFAYVERIDEQGRGIGAVNFPDETFVSPPEPAVLPEPVAPTRLAALRESGPQELPVEQAPPVLPSPRTPIRKNRIIRED